MAGKSTEIGLALLAMAAATLGWIFKSRYEDATPERKRSLQRLGIAGGPVALTLAAGLVFLDPSEHSPPTASGLPATHGSSHPASGDVPLVSRTVVPTTGAAPVAVPSTSRYSRVSRYFDYPHWWAARSTA